MLATLPTTIIILQSTISQLVIRTPITVIIHRLRRKILFIMSVPPLAERCFHFFGGPIDHRDIAVAASALHCPKRSTSTIVRPLLSSRHLRELFCRCAGDILEFRVDLRFSSHSTPSRVSAACCAIRRMSDADIDALIRRLVAY